MEAVEGIEQMCERDHKEGVRREKGERTEGDEAHSSTPSQQPTCAHTQRTQPAGSLCFHSQKCKWAAAEPDGPDLTLVSGRREEETTEGGGCTSSGQRVFRHRLCGCDVRDTNRTALEADHIQVKCSGVGDRSITNKKRAADGVSDEHELPRKHVTERWLRLAIAPSITTVESSVAAINLGVCE